MKTWEELHQAHQSKTRVKCVFRPLAYGKEGYITRFGKTIDNLQDYYIVSDDNGKQIGLIWGDQASWQDASLPMPLDAIQMLRNKESEKLKQKSGENASD